MCIRDSSQVDRPNDLGLNFLVGLGLNSAKPGMTSTVAGRPWLDRVESLLNQPVEPSIEVENRKTPGINVLPGKSYENFTGIN